ncbi:MAG: hypothetical protein C4297_05035 [Gemmataceae bacterium]
MHKKLAAQGLVAMSVNLDDPTDEKTMHSVRQFLKEQQAQFQHFVLDEKIEVWQKRLGIDGPPAVFVFSRDGKLAFKETEVDYREIEKKVQTLLNQPQK